MKQIVRKDKFKPELKLWAPSLAAIWRLRPCPQAVPFVIAFGSVYSEQDGNEEQEWDWIVRGPGSGNKRGPLHSFHTVKREIFQTQATIDGWAYFTPWSCLFQWCHCWNREGKENQQHCHLAVIPCPDHWTPILASLHASHWKEGEGRQFRRFFKLWQ